MLKECIVRVPAKLLDWKCINSIPGPPGYPVDAIVTVSAISNVPDTINEPVISALPLCVPSQSLVTPVSPDPSPTKEPENIDPEIVTTSVKSTILVDPETTNEPVISALPFLDPSHSIPVRLLPFPTKDQLNIDADT